MRKVGNLLKCQQKFKAKNTFKDSVTAEKLGKFGVVFCYVTLHYIMLRYVTEVAEESCLHYNHSFGSKELCQNGSSYRRDVKENQ